MLAIVASLEPEVAPLVPRRWSAHEIKLQVPSIPVVLKVCIWDGVCALCVCVCVCVCVCTHVWG